VAAEACRFILDTCVATEREEPGSRGTGDCAAMVKCDVAAASAHPLQRAPLRTRPMLEGARIGGSEAIRGAPSRHSLYPGAAGCPEAPRVQRPTIVKTSACAVDLPAASMAVKTARYRPVASALRPMRPLKAILFGPAWPLRVSVLRVIVRLQRGRWRSRGEAARQRWCTSLPLVDRWMVTFTVAGWSSWNEKVVPLWWRRAVWPVSGVDLFATANTE
jgi:hypothetical protein